MTKRDFFKIIIKLVVLYLFVLVIFSLFSTIAFYLTENNIRFSDLESNALTIGINLAILILFLFLEDHIISLLHLEEGFDDDKIVIGNLDIEKWTQFMIVFLGLFLIMQALPIFSTYSFILIKEKMKHSNTSFIDDYRVISYSISIAKIIIGFITIRSSGKIAKFFNEDVKKL